MLVSPPCHGEPTPAPSLLTPQVKKELFDALDLSAPALSPVREALANGQDTLAVHALAEYLRHRNGPVIKPAIRNPVTDLPAQKKIADEAAKGNVGGWVPIMHQFPDGKIDWLYDAPKNTPGEPPNEEWQWQLCRMNFWENFCRVYLATHDERYPRAWVEQFRSFVAECPPPTTVQNGPGSPWRTLEAGLRMTYSWIDSYETFLGNPAFTDDDAALFMHSCMQHARYLKQFPSAGGNWVTMEMLGLYTVGVLFPEFKEAREWRDFAATMNYNQEKDQFLPDGVQFELSMSYANVSMDSIMEIPNLAKRVGRLDELPADYVPRMEKAYDFDLHFMNPEHTLPQFNDSGVVKVAGQLNKALTFFPQRQDYRWVVSDGKEGQPPAETSHAFDWAGFFVMRSGWEKDANYLVLRAGPIGYGHCQQNKLAIVIWAFGRQVLFNAGGGQYEHSPWRTYAVDSFSHSCVIVDGKSQRQQTSDRFANVAKGPTDARWESTPDHDFAAGVFDQGYGEVDNRIATQTRRVLFIKPDIFVVADSLVPNDNAAHTYQARWQLLSTQTHLDDATKAVTTTDPGLSNLAVVPLLTDGLEVRSASAQTEPEILGWRIEAIPKRTPATTVLQTRKGTGQQDFLTLFLPTRAGGSLHVQSVQATGAHARTVKLSDGRSFSISVDPDPKGGMEFSETLSSGATGRHTLIKPRL